MVALLFGSLQVWGAVGDLVTSVTPTSDLASGTTYQAETGTDWAVNVTNNSAFGTNAKSSNDGKLKLSNNSDTESRNTAIASALASYTGDEFTDKTQYVAALIGLSSISNVAKVGVTYTGTNGGNPDDMWVLYTTNSGTSYTVVGHTSSFPSSGTNITFSTVASAQYAVVFKRTAAFGLKGATISFYEGAAAGFTVTINKNNNSYGNVSAASVTGVTSGTSISASGNVLSVGATDVTATPNSGYKFTGWTGIPGGGTVTENLTVTANFAAVSYSNYRTLCTTKNPSLSVSPASLTGLDYIVGAGPSASQSFTVSGSSLGADLVVTAPANYEVCKTADGTYTSTISYTPSDGAVANTTAYIRLAAGLNVGTYNYAAASGLQVTSTGAKTRTAALNGSVTKADCAITFTDFNAVDHYEATLEYGSRVTVSYNYTYNGDGNFSISRSPATGTIDKANKTLTVSTAGIWTLNASATAGTNYSKPSDASAQIRVKCVDTYKDFIHNKTIKAYGSGTAVTDGKMEDWGSGYTVPYIDDNAEETSGSCQQTHYKFMGWVSEDDINIADGTFKTGWTLIQAGTESKLATTKTYYAVWAKLEE